MLDVLDQARAIVASCAVTGIKGSSISWSAWTIQQDIDTFGMSCAYCKAQDVWFFDNDGHSFCSMLHCQLFHRKVG